MVYNYFEFGDDFVYNVSLILISLFSEFWC